MLPWKPSILEGKILNSSAYKFIQMTREKTGRERIFHVINCFCNSICQLGHFNKTQHLLIQVRAQEKWIKHLYLFGDQILLIFAFFNSLLNQNVMANVNRDNVQLLFFLLNFRHITEEHLHIWPSENSN